ncbi:MAG: hypothetical protein ACK4RZ_01180 [Paracoccaceae bacterium]
MTVSGGKPQIKKGYLQADTAPFGDATQPLVEAEPSSPCGQVRLGKSRMTPLAKAGSVVKTSAKTRTRLRMGFS